MKKTVLTAALLPLVTGLQSSKAFSDVVMTDKLYLGLSYMAEKGIIGGYDDGTFNTEGTLNRAAAIKIILTAAEVEIEDPTEEIFPDVPLDAWFAGYVNQAQKLGIAKGDEDTGEFFPDREVNRAEFLKIMLTTFGIDPTKFKLEDLPNDVPDETWFTPYIQFAIKFKLMDLDGKGNAYPSHAVTRGEAADILYRTIKTGKALKPQILLKLSEDHLVKTIELLEANLLPGAGIAVNMAQRYIDESIKIVPDNEIIQSADKTVRAVKNLVGAYTAGEHGRIEDVLKATGKAWNLANEAGQLNPSQSVMTEAIKNLAHELAKKTRSVKGELADFKANPEAASSEQKPEAPKKEVAIPSAEPEEEIEEAEEVEEAEIETPAEETEEDLEARIRAEVEARMKAEIAKKKKAEADAKKKAAKEAAAKKAKAEAEAKKKAEEEMRKKIEAEEAAKAKAEAEKEEPAEEGPTKEELMAQLKALQAILSQMEK